ncbi:MAG: sigma-54-dependent Fis family transcriptional regulator, partial [bacterium]|nr:sigma-54-dependent Fis family transcriptional regulator [bacterium]
SFFLYLDSGTKKTFSQLDYEIFKSLGEVLGDTINQIRKNQRGAGGITGSGWKVKYLRDKVTQYSLIDEPILLKGETGTGKSHIAELIHIYSGRLGKFKVINTPGIPGSLFESEMFGHTKGAFTDAKYQREGLVSEAEGGTLFIDEITEIPLSIQAKLLRFVETRKYSVLGESGERTADVRIVAATNKDVSGAIKNNEFREDLYYRLNVFEIDLPPLRDRKEDLKDLVYDNLMYLNGKKIGNGFWDILYNHDWPGNTRELISVLKRAGAMDKDPIDGEAVREIINMTSHIKKSHAPGEKVNRIWDKMKSGGNFWEVVKAPYLDRELNRCEVKEIIERGLMETGGKYKGLLNLFGLQKKEYKNFMGFLYSNRLK